MERQAAAQRPEPARAQEERGTGVSRDTASDPVGGFILITVVRICMAWWCYATRLIQFRDLRVWLACFELRERRVAYRKACRKRGERPNPNRRFTLDELQGLVGGVGGEHLRASIRRLEALGLLSWSETSITIARSPDELRVENLNGYWVMLELIKNNRRAVPVPRQTLRFLAGGARPVVMATVFGHLLRCVYNRRGSNGAGGRVRCTSVGRCKASWVAKVFGVDLRGVKRARRHLAELGWLTRQPSAQWLEKRWGAFVTVNLSWSRADASTNAVPAADVGEIAVDNAVSSTTGLPPQQAQSTTKLPPLESDKQLPLGSKNQQPGGLDPTGVLKREGKKKKPRPFQVEPLHFRDTAAALGLFQEATVLGYVEGSDYDQLRFFAAMEHARVIGTTNREGLFAALVRRGLFHFATNDDEDQAQRRLKEHIHGPTREAGPRRQRRGNEAPEPLSDDARLARAVITVARERRHANPFVLYRRMRPEATREDFDRATEELEQVRFLQARLNAKTVLDLV